MDLSPLRTGDLLLFSSRPSGFFSGLLSYAIKYGTHSDYTHVGMVLRDPTWLSPSLRGLFLWQSTSRGEPDAEDREAKFGVQITPLRDVLAEQETAIFCRRAQMPDWCFTPENLAKAHAVVHDKTYDADPRDWIQALFRVDLRPQKTDKFWCSALVGYIYTACGALDPGTDWSILRPSDFSLSGQNLTLEAGCALDCSETRLV